MAIDSNGTHSHVPAGERLNAYALVIYIPDPLGRFLDDLRRELVPNYNPHAHVSVLPPRPLAVEWQVASQQARVLTEAWPPFDVELTEVDMFPVTQVIYIGIGAGGEQLTGMHSAMSTGVLEFQEPFPYHPHITLAQDVPPTDINAVYELAKRRWREYRGKRTFRAERAAFVQNTMNNLWLDLAEYSLGEYRPVV
jgi:2'-5' RNA ligase